MEYPGLPASSTDLNGALVIENVYLLHDNLSTLHTVVVGNGRIEHIFPAPATPYIPTNVNGNGGILIPSLCHSHIHLDKPYIIAKCPPVEHGELKEVVEVTNFAKTNFNVEELVERGRRLVEQSVQSGVTAIRAFVEVDQWVGMKCVEAGVKLKREFEGKGICDLQITGGWSSNQCEERRK
jgi:cytosine/adenosine deaminase-related metal-dependent hydrolase